MTGVVASVAAVGMVNKRKRLKKCAMRMADEVDCVTL